LLSLPDGIQLVDPIPYHSAAERPPVEREVARDGADEGPLRVHDRVAGSLLIHHQQGISRYTLESVRGGVLARALSRSPAGPDEGAVGTEDPQLIRLPVQNGDPPRFIDGKGGDRTERL